MNSPLCLRVVKRGDLPFAAFVRRLGRFIISSCAVATAWLLLTPQANAEAPSAAPAWTSPNRFRLLLTVDLKRRNRSHSPASVEVDFQQALAAQDASGRFDEHTVEVVSLSPARAPAPVPHRLDRYFGITGATLAFVVPDRTCTNFAVYFDTEESGQGRPMRYHGLIGDGDKFCEEFGRREISASHFDQFVDFDGDGDLDLFKGGVEPFVYCFENVGGNRFVSRGRLTSGGKLLTLPRGKSNRSWVTVAFHDIDGDGNQDFFPTFGDGPDAGKIIFYRNTTRENGGQLTFTRIGPLRAVSGTPLAGGAQAGGWFPSIAFVKDWDGDGAGPDALVGSNNRCWLYRGLSPHVREEQDGAPAPRSVGRVRSREKRPTFRPSPTGEGRRESEPREPLFADAVAVQAGGKEIVLVNPRFDCADIDGDGDLDLFGATQPGPVYWFENIGTRAKPEFAPGIVLAWSGKYLIGDAHSGVKVADFDGDGLLDIESGRFWERADMSVPDAPHDFGGFFKNVGSRRLPRFEKRTRDGPFTEQFQLCDAVRQNSVRAADWDGDGKPDLLAGDTDGFIWFFKVLSRSSRREEALLKRGTRNAERGVLSQGLLTSARAPATWSLFASAEKLLAAGQPLSVAASGGHARFDICDWNNDGRKDLVVADGQGSLTLFLNNGRKSKPALTAGQKISADGKAIQLDARSSVLVCDWDNDRRKDLVLADEKGYYLCKNVGTDAAPLLAAAKPILFGGRKVSYVRPNLGSFVDWDGDGKRDLIGCHFENSIRFYRNIGSGAPGEEPQFADPDGVVILQGESPQMISGAEAVDWNGDGDIDLLTGQGHGGSGLRFYERDWLDDELGRTHPVVTLRAAETKPKHP